MHGSLPTIPCPCTRFSTSPLLPTRAPHHTHPPPQALGQKQIKLTDIPDWLSRHLLPMPPICFNYTVKLAGDSPSQPDCYDLDFQVGRQGGGHLGAPVALLTTLPTSEGGCTQEQEGSRCQACTLGRMRSCWASTM